MSIMPSRFLVLLLLSLSMVSSAVSAGPISSVAKIAREGVEYAGRKLTDDMAKGALDELPDYALRYPQGLQIALKRLPLDKRKAVLGRIRHHNLARALPEAEADDAVAFLARTGVDGAVVLKRFGWRDAKRSGLTRPDANEVVREAGQLIRPGLNGDWGRLRASLRDANLSGRQRDFAEILFADRAKAGRIPGLENTSLFPAQHNGVNGLDFIALDQGKIRVIEFGTGKKPSPIAGQDLGVQMDWPWIEKNFQAFLHNLDANSKISLREAGFPNDLLQKPELLTGNRLRQTVQRDIYAVEPDPALLKRLGNDVSFRCLEPTPECTSRVATRIAG